MIDKVDERENTDELCVETSDDIPRSLILDQDLKSWLAEIEALDSELRIYLYKYNAQNKRAIANVFYEIPNIHEIGIEYGSGRYELHVPITRLQKTRVYKFSLHESYDLRKAERDRQNKPPVQTQQPVQPQIDPVQLMQTIFTISNQMVSNIVAAISGNKPNGTSPELINNMMLQNAQMVNEVVKNSMTSQMDMYKNIINQVKSGELTAIKEDEFEEEEEENKGASLIDSLMPLFEKFLPLLLTPKQEKTIVPLIKKYPEYKKIIGNPALQAALKEKVAQKVKDPRKTETVLNNLGFNGNSKQKEKVVKK